MTLHYVTFRHNKILNPEGALVDGWDVHCSCGVRLPERKDLYYTDMDTVQFVMSEHRRKPNAAKEGRKQQSNFGEHPRTSPQRASSETGGRDSDEQSGPLEREVVEEQKKSVSIEDVLSEKDKKELEHLEESNRA